MPIHQKDREILETIKRLVGAGADVYIRQRITAEEVANHQLILRTDGPVQVVHDFDPMADDVLLTCAGNLRLVEPQYEVRLTTSDGQPL